MEFDGVRALVVLPELPVAGGAVGAPASVVLEELGDCRVFPVDSFGVLPVGGVALAEGSAAALFLVLLVAVGVAFAFSPSVFPVFSVLVLDLFREEVAEVPEPLVELSVPAAPFESVLLLDLVS
jgi:hypothetical protein